jgi:hypothetical protein
MKDAEEDAISRLAVQAQQYLQEQEETKSKVLGDNNTDSSMEEMMDRKIKVRFDKMESEWN